MLQDNLIKNKILKQRRAERQAALGLIFWGIEGVSWGTVLAIASQFFIQVPVLGRLGIRYRPVLNLRHPGLIKMGTLVLPVLVGVGAGQLNVMVDRILASGPALILRIILRIINLKGGAARAAIRPR